MKRRAWLLILALAVPIACAAASGVFPRRELGLRGIELLEELAARRMTAECPPPLPEQSGYQHLILPASDRVDGTAVLHSAGFYISGPTPVPKTDCYEWIYFTGTP